MECGDRRGRERERWFEVIFLQCVTKFRSIGKRFPLAKRI